MIHVYKQTRQPVSAFEVMRIGGPNNIAPETPERFLVLWNVNAIKRSDTWHYIFDFDARDSLEMSELGKLMNGPRGKREYQNAADWAKWLGQGWRLVSESDRWLILHPLDGSSKGSASITNIRVGGGTTPMPE